MSAAAPSIATRSRWPWVMVAVYLLILPVTLWLTGVNGRSWLESSPAVIAFTAFGAIPFVADSARVMREVARVLRPGGRWVFATNHPIRWAFPDDPGPGGLTVTMSYFDRRPYVECVDDGTPTYVEHHRTLGDRVREIVAAGFRLVDLIEPEWPAGHDQEWGQWSPLRGALLPGTAIYVCELS